MSWLARSLATSLNIPDGDPGADDDPDTAPSPSACIPPPPPPPPHLLHSAAAEGVKEDLTEITKTLTRQFWGVANFLAPPPGETTPSPSPSPPSAEGQYGTEETLPDIVGIRSDFAEIGGRFKSGISRISGHKAVSGFSRIASNFFADEDGEEKELLDAVRNEGEEEQREEVRFGMEAATEDRVRHETEDGKGKRDWEESVRHGVEEDEARYEWEVRLRHEVEDGEGRHEDLDDHELEESVRHEEEKEEEDEDEEWDVIGITEEVLAFATNIARHPETWLDFPLLPDDEESNGPFSCNFFAPQAQLLLSNLDKMQCSPVRTICIGLTMESMS